MRFSMAANYVHELILRIQTKQSFYREGEREREGKASKRRVRSR